MAQTIQAPISDGRTMTIMVNGTGSTALDLDVSTDKRALKLLQIIVTCDAPGTASTIDVSVTYPGFENAPTGGNTVRQLTIDSNDGIITFPYYDDKSDAQTGSIYIVKGMLMTFAGALPDNWSACFTFEQLWN